MHAPLAFRPPTALKRLRPGSRACPLSVRDVTGALLGEVAPLPAIVAGSVPVVRAALVAAQEAGSVVGLGLPPGGPPERWFLAVAEAADELAPGLPVLLCAEVALLPGGGVEAVRARRMVHRLVDAGITWLVLDLDRLPPEERAEGLAQASDPALERGLGVECLLPPGLGGFPEPEEVFSLLSELGSLGATPDLAGVRMPAPEAGGGAAAQAALLRAIAAASPGVELCRRGPGAEDVAARLDPGEVRGWGDGGEVSQAGERAGGADGGEARAYARAADLLDGIRARGSAADLAAALGRVREG